MTRFAPPGRVITASSSAMAHLGMSDDEMTTFIKDGFGVDSSFSAKDLFEAAELPSWLSVRTDLGLSKSAGLQLQNALLKAIEARAAPGSKRKAAEAPQALPTDGLGRPLVHGRSVVNGVCRDPGSPPRASQLLRVIQRGASLGAALESPPAIPALRPSSQAACWHD